MSINLFISPSGQLRLEEVDLAPPEISTSATSAIHEAFARSSADGLLRLASHEIDEELPAAFVFWRGLARLFFQSLCQLGEGSFDKWKDIAAPEKRQLESLVIDAPPMRGLEYLTVELLERLWYELRELVVVQALEFKDGPAGFLISVNPLWHLLGRVTFHLAENKRDESRPFAFMATFTNRLSGQSRLQHVPLAEALKTFVTANDRTKLEALLEPVRRASEKSPLVKALLESKSLFAPQAWTIQQAYRFLSESAAMEESGVIVRLPDWWSARKTLRPQVSVTIGGNATSIVGMNALLDFQVDLTIDGEPLTEAEREQLMAATDGLSLLRGKWVEVNREKLNEALEHWRVLQKEHAGGIDFIHGMRMLAGAKLDVETQSAEEVVSWSRITAGSWLKETLDHLRNPSSITNCQPGLDLNATLRPYQVEGVRWLWFMTELGLGGCLADDMGLGKTIQVIDLLLQRKRSFVAQNSDHARNRSHKKEAVSEVRPNLLVVPASLIGNWREELKRFAPQLKVFVVHRSECDAEKMGQLAANPQQELAGIDVVIATYGVARRLEWLSKMSWSLVVLDEAQAIKNASAAQTKSVKKLSAASRIVLTGTPVENNLGDVWSLFDFCCPGLLGSASDFKKFAKRLNQQQDASAYGSLRRLVRPYILRRMKTDPAIVPDLPEKTEMRTECGLSKKQAVLYERAVNDLAKRLLEVDGITRRGLVLAALMQFKQICDHPALHLVGTPFAAADSGKFERLALLCEPIVERQEKVLVFTQFQSMTQPLADFLATVFGMTGLVLHGGTPVKKRGELVKAFQSEDGPPFFVISLKAGGTGLNLTAASHVVHFDRWWNPAIENQATDRAFRIGQKRNVLVHKFVCRGTIEERIDAMITDKKAIADQLLGEESVPMLTEMTDKELLDFVALDISRATADES